MPRPCACSSAPGCSRPRTCASGRCWLSKSPGKPRDLRDAPRPARPPPAATAPQRFTDVAPRRPPDLHPRARRHARASHRRDDGLGLAWLDYDGDGWMDLYVVQSGPFPPGRRARSAQDRLFRNNGDGTFEDVTAKAGLKDTAYGMGAFAGRLRQRRLRGPLRDQLGRQHPLPQQGRRHVSRTSRRRPRVSRRRPGARPPPGETSTATAGSTSTSRATSTTRARRTSSAATR